MLLQSEHIYLRALEPDDYKTTIKWRQDPEIWETLLGKEHIVSEAYEKQWVEKAIFDTQAVRCAVCLRETHKMIGLVTLYDFNNKDRNCCISYIIGEKELYGHGYATQAVKLMLSYAFNKCNMVRVSTRIMDSNIASQKVIEHCGAKCEGTLRKAVYKDGEYKDVIIFGVLKDELR